ncbi:MAG: hypothetical protein AAFV33_13245, partial [Chloroflexota bacterium]
IDVDAEQMPDDAVYLGQAIIDEMVFVGTRYECTGRHEATGSRMILTLPQNTRHRRGEDVSITVLKDDVVVLTA